MAAMGIPGLRKRRSGASRSTRFPDYFRGGFGEGGAGEDGDADAVGVARRGVTQDFGSSFAGGGGEILTRTVFDRIAPDGRISGEGRHSQVERAGRIDAHREARVFEGIDGPGGIGEFGEEQ